MIGKRSWKQKGKTCFWIAYFLISYVLAEISWFQEGLQFLESSRNEIIYKTKKVEYILEKEKRARRGSQDINKMARLKAWLLTKVSILKFCHQGAHAFNFERFLNFHSFDDFDDGFESFKVEM